MAGLTLSRNAGEEILLDTELGQITITVVEVRRGRVKLQVTAPREVQIHRSEVRERLIHEIFHGTRG